MSLAITNTNWWEKRSSNVPEEFGAQKHPFAHVSQSKSIKSINLSNNQISGQRITYHKNSTLEGVLATNIDIQIPFL